MLTETSDNTIGRTMEPVIPLVALCDELGVSRRTWNRWESQGVIPEQAVVTYHTQRYVRFAVLDEVMQSIARYRAGNRSTT